MGEAGVPIGRLESVDRWFTRSTNLSAEHNSRTPASPIPIPDEARVPRVELWRRRRDGGRDGVIKICSHPVWLDWHYYLSLNLFWDCGIGLLTPRYYAIRTLFFNSLDSILDAIHG
jgi:hypothetical protein